MIRLRYWHQLPSAPVLKALPLLTWQRLDELSPAAGTAALMIYVALCFMAEDLAEPSANLGDVLMLTRRVAAASYDDLGDATGLSRSLISQGLKRLQTLNLITPEGSHQKRRYRITWGETKWFKLPCQYIVTGNRVQPFKNFTLRSKYELHAMKLYLYLAAVRDNYTSFTSASYETIFKRIGIPERDIRKAISVLIAVGLLTNVGRDHIPGEYAHGPNKYYLTGYQNLFKTVPVETASTTKPASTIGT